MSDTFDVRGGTRARLAQRQPQIVVPGLVVELDRGLANSDVFGLFEDLIAELEDAPVPRPQHDGRFELLAADFARAVELSNQQLRGGANKKDFLDQLNALLADPASDTAVDAIDLELENLDVEVIARARFDAPDVSREELVTFLKTSFGDDAQLIEVTNPPTSTLQFKPGLLSFAPGLLSFAPGLLSFAPGLLSFAPGAILPQPMATPNELIEQTHRARWEAAMRYPDRPRAVSVAVLDTGIDANAQREHPLFAGQNAEDPLGGSPDLELEPVNGVVDPVYGHGTHVAGIVAMRAPLATLNHESVRRASGVSDAFELTRDMGDIANSDIVVFSFATSAPSEADLPVLKAVIRQLISDGKVVVAAAGTTFDLQVDEDTGLFPADFTEVTIEGNDVDLLAPLDFEITNRPIGRLISVGAVDSTGQPMEGDRRIDGAVRPNHVVSYGVGIASAFPEGQIRWGIDGPSLSYQGWARWTGTSMAAPRVAGAIAAHYQANPDVETVAEAADAVLLAARDVGGLVE